MTDAFPVKQHMLTIGARLPQSPKPEAPTADQNGGSRGRGVKCSAAVDARSSSSNTVSMASAEEGRRRRRRREEDGRRGRAAVVVTMREDVLLYWLVSSVMRQFCAMTSLGPDLGT